MKSSARLLSGIAAIALHALAIWAAPPATDSRALPACSDKDIGNCTCPAGTEYQAATTYAVIGTNAQTFQKLYGSCGFLPIHCPLFFFFSYSFFFFGSKKLRSLYRYT